MRARGRAVGERLRGHRRPPGLVGGEEVDDLLEAEPATAAVLLEPAGDTGPNPFTEPAAPAPDDALRLFAEQGAPIVDDDAMSDPADALVAEDGYFAVDGSTPGLFGGTNRDGSCDADQIADYLDATTAVQLGADTRVRNHGFADGRATPREAILQRGSAVLVDDRGVPVVRCACGNPLLPPTVTPDEVVAGETWENYRDGEVLVIQPVPVAIEVFQITDIATGTRIDRPTGTRGEQDEPTRPAVLRTDEDTDGDGEGVGCGLLSVDRSERSPGQPWRYQPQIVSGAPSCDEVDEIVQRYIDDHSGTSVDIGAWQCDPANARLVAEGIAAVCRSGDAVVHVTVLELVEAENGASQDTAADADPGAAVGDEQRCGTLSSDIGSLSAVGVDSGRIELFVTGAATCENAEQVATAFLIEFADWALAQGSVSMDDVPYLTDVNGWQCDSEGLLAPLFPDHPRCFLPGAELQMRLPPG